MVAAIAWSMRAAALPEPLPAPKAPALPDLAMSPLTDIAVSEAVGSDARYVSFTAAPANVGRGALIIHAVRADRRGGWRVRSGSTSRTVR